MSLQHATFGSGCFWCTEAIFQQLKGVKKVVSGYTGGQTSNPTYQEICTGDTGHAEVINVEYEENEITFDELLLVFFKTHDPTTLNRQGNDAGTQYRSAIFYHSAAQQQQAIAMINRLNLEKIYDQPIVTEVTPIAEFYTAESYHQNYFNDNTNKPYCAFVIQPKLDKFTKDFKERLKA